MPIQPSNHSASRRSFLQSSGLAVGAVASGISIERSAFASGADTIRVGLVGCGGRGTGAASQALNADKGVTITSLADVFPDQLERSLRILQREAPERVKVDPANCFVGLDAYKKVIESGVDVVLLATPPGFRPEHLAAAVAANKHVFCEKPMATDAPGVRSVLASAAAAKEKNLSIVAGFCWRFDAARRAVYQQIHDGAAGDLRAIYATYYTGPVKPMPAPDKRTPEMTDVEWQMRNWYNFVWLSGDGLVEQAVHSVDKIMWTMKDTPPTVAVAVGGRQIPNHEGNIYDHFEVNYEFPNGTRAFMGCRQQAGCYNENRDYILGTKGVATIDSNPNRPPVIEGETNWRYTGPKSNMYQVEHDELFASIRSGKPINDGIWMAQSTLAAIMGRMAAYTGTAVTWEQALNSREQLVPSPLAWDMKLAIRPMAMPGQTKFE